jgi:hypothetical protein
MVAVENTPELHNVVVCTLCSCLTLWLSALRTAQDPLPCLLDLPGRKMPDLG